MKRLLLLPYNIFPGRPKQKTDRQERKESRPIDIAMFSPFGAGSGKYNSKWIRRSGIEKVNAPKHRSTVVVGLEELPQVVPQVLTNLEIISFCHGLK